MTRDLAQEAEDFRMNYGGKTLKVQFYTTLNDLRTYTGVILKGGQVSPIQYVLIQTDEGVKSFRIDRLQAYGLATPAVDLPDLGEYTESQLQELRKKLDKRLDSKNITLYSVNGQKWGKKKHEDAKFRMTYTLYKGEITDLKQERI